MGVEGNNVLDESDGGGQAAMMADPVVWEATMCAARLRHYKKEQNS